MRRTIVLVAVLTIAFLAPSVAASAYELTGWDPDESTDFGANIIRDLRSSLLRVETRERERVLVLVVRSYEDFGEGWIVTGRVDSREGRAFDRVMILHPRYSEQAPATCIVYTRAGYGRGRSLAEGVFRQNGKAIRCRVAIRYFEPTKAIRWSLLSEEAGDPSAGADRAPDRGAYP